MTSASVKVPRSHLRLTTRGRLVLTTLGALPLVVAAAVVALNGGGAIASGETASASFEYVQVMSGESLWELAGSISPESDPRDVVADIVHLNQLPSSDVQPGQQLAVPEQYVD